MIKTERENQILKLLKENGGFITVERLCKELYASPSSIRRDLSRLESSGNVKRCYGGAELIKSYSGSIPFNYRYTLNEKAKKIIAEKAVSLIKDNSVIFLDQSSSAFYVATMLPNLKSLTVVTNNIEIINYLLPLNITVISSGGVLCNDNRSCLIGQNAEYTFSKIYADFAFISSKSLSYSGDISDCARDELPVRDAMIKNADKVVYLCDGSKLKTISPYIQCDLSKIDYLISDVDISYFQNKFPSLTIL